MSYLRLLPAFALMVTLGIASCQAMGSRGGSAATLSGADCRIAHVIDGDTVAMDCPGLGEIRARLTGFDTPEAFDPSCPAEAGLAGAATERLQNLVRSASTVEPRFDGTDRYGRRLVRLRLDGHDVGTILVGEGLAVRYSGGPRPDWCARPS